MSQKLPIKNLKWVKDISRIDESFIKCYNVESDKGYFLEVDVRYPEKLLHDKTEYVMYRYETMN